MLSNVVPYVMVVGFGFQVIVGIAFPINWPKAIGWFIKIPGIIVGRYVDVSITETVPLPSFATYTFFPSGRTAIPTGPIPIVSIGDWEITCFEAVSITETV